MNRHLEDAASMYTPDREYLWLERQWDRGTYWQPVGAFDWILLPADHSRLAHGYIGCNLVADLVDEFTDLLRYPTIPLTPHLTCGELRDLLIFRNQNYSTDVAELAAPAAHPAVDSRALNDPWKAINVWLWRDAVIRHLTPLASRAPRTAAYLAATNLFRGTRTLPPPATLPHYSGRSQAAVAAFDQWWDDASGKLVSALDAGFFPNAVLAPPGPGSCSCHAELSRALCDAPLHAGPDGPVPPDACSCPLTLRLQSLNREMTECWSQATGSGPTVPQPRWFLGMKSKLAAAKQIQRGLPRWSRADHLSLQAIDQWAVANVQLAPAPALSPTAVGGTLYPHEVDTLLGYWRDICTTFRGPFAQNLFCRRPLDSFDQWRSDMTQYNWT